MKVLVDNYSSIYTTEPMYLSTTINSIDGCSSTIFPTDYKISVYDKFDLVKPDIYITHAMFLNNDVISYLVENKNIQVVINISGINQAQVSQVEEMFLYHNLKSLLFFINYHNHGLVCKNFNIFALPHSADLYLGVSKDVKYDIDSGIIVSEKSQISKRNGTYHYISLNNSMIKDVDIVMSTVQLSNIYQNYKNIIIKPFRKVVPQYFYDAIFYGQSVSYENDGKEDPMIDMIQGIFKDLDPKVLKETVRNKHTCLNRTKSLLSQLPCNEIVIKLGKMMEGIKWE
jgi:hypothetical protein